MAACRSLRNRRRSNFASRAFSRLFRLQPRFFLFLRVAYSASNLALIALFCQLLECVGSVDPGIEIRFNLAAQAIHAARVN